MGEMGCRGGGETLRVAMGKWGGRPRTSNTKRPQPEVHPIEDDEAHGEVELASIFGVALEVP